MNGSFEPAHKLFGKRLARMQRWIAAGIILLQCCTLGVRGAIEVNLLQRNYTLDEDSGSSVCFRVTAPPLSSAQLVFESISGSARDIEDYTLNVNHTISLPASLPRQEGSDSIIIDLCLPVFELCHDDVAEEDENFTVAFSSPDPSVTLLQNNFTVIIIDDDRVQVSFTRARYTVMEGEEIEVCAEARESSERDFVPLSISTSPGTARNIDYYVSGARLNRQGRRFQKCMTLAAVDDNLPEEREFFKISISSTEPLVDVDENPVRVYITDNDPLTFSLAQSLYEVEEGETARVCLEASDHDLPLIRFHLIILNIGGNATGQDYSVHQERDYVIGISSYTESHEICFNVDTTDDNISEGNESERFQLLLSTNVPWVMLTMPSQTIVNISIIDNDVVSVEFVEESYYAIEGVSPIISVCINATGRVSHNISPSLTLSTASETATSEVDFIASSLSISLPISVVCHQVMIIDDSRPELEEQFHMCIDSTSPLVHIPIHCTTIHLFDNDIPELGWEETTVYVDEDEEEVQLCAQLVGTLQYDVEIHLSSTDITAIGMFDYDGPIEKTFLFGPSYELRQCLSIHIISDQLSEEEEVFRVSLNFTGAHDLTISHPFTYIHIEDSSTDFGCSEGDVLLNQGTESYQGNLVEICTKGGRWKSACDSDWTQEDAATVCHQTSQSRLVASQVSLGSLESTAGIFECSSTEPKLTHCFGEKLYNVTCHHLLLSCAEETLATSSPQYSSSPGGNTPLSSPGSRLGQPAPSSTQFPAIGMIVGVFSALLLVGVVIVVGVVYGVVIWRRNKINHLVLSQRRDAEAPVYEDLEGRMRTTTPSPSNTNTTNTSSSSNTDLYSEIPPLSSPSPPHQTLYHQTPPHQQAPPLTLPSFYDVIRPHNNEVVSHDPIESTQSNGVGEETTNGQKTEANDNLYESTSHTNLEETNYESVTDPFSNLEASGEYSTLERRQGGYATLEPYIGSGPMRLKQLTKEQEERGKKEKKEEEEEEQYAHLNH